MRYPKKVTLKEIFTSKLIPEIKRLLDNRQRVLAQFPIDPLQLYEMFWTDREREALQLLQRREGVLMTRNHFNLARVPTDSSKVPHVKVRVMMPTSLPLPFDSNIMFDDLPHTMRLQVVQWAPIWMNYKVEEVTTVSKVERLASVCSTLGQAIRIWPELLSLYPADAKERLEKARALSKYPDVVRLFDGSATLLEEFRPEAYAPFTAILAEASLLPTMTDMRHRAIIEM